MIRFNKILVVVALICLSANSLLSESKENKKELSKSEILRGIPDGIVKSLPKVKGWVSNTSLELLANDDIYIFNAKTGKSKLQKLKEDNLKKWEKADDLSNFAENPEAKNAKNITFSPDKTKIAFTNKENNLCVYDVNTKTVKYLTNDGTNVIMNGYASWVYYEEILGRRTNYKAFWWSPDSKLIAYYKFDDTKVPMFPIYDSKGKHGTLTQTRYPKTGDTNPEVKIGFVNVLSGSTVWADFDSKEDQYFGIPFWNGEGNKFIIPWMPREQNNLKLYAVDPNNGKKSFIYNETQETWIDWMKDMQFTPNGFYMVRDFTGWEQIYYQSFDGEELKQITTGNNWGIKFIKVDLKTNEIYFTARREISTRNDFYKVNLKNNKITRLSFGDYNFTNILLSPDNKYYSTIFSNSATPPQLAVINTVGKKNLKVISDAQGENFNDYKLALPQMLSLTTTDGYVLPAYIIYPVDMDSTKKYPVIVDIYGGPNNGTVMDMWRGINENTQWWANEGVILISIDHRASGHCGKQGLNFVHRNLLTIELQDYIEWIKYLRTKPYINSDKVGIVGFSYGGSMTVLACTEGSEYFKYGIAGGGVYDYNLYDTHYGERYMDRPQDNPKGYENTNLSKKIASYKGDSTNFLRITHGTSDDNVHLQNTMQLIDALQEGRKQFELMLYPGEFHGYRGRKYMHSLTSDYIFWYKYLLEKPMPSILYR